MNTIAENAIVVIHADAANVRAGVGGETAPRIVFATPDGLIGSQGAITNQNLAKDMFSRVFQGLNVDAEEHAVLVITVAKASKADIESLETCLFDDFNVPALSVANDSTLTIITKGDDTNGMAVHITGTDVRTTCVLENRSIPQTVTVTVDISSGVHSSLLKVDPDKRKPLCANINLTGDASTELALDLKGDLTKLVPADFAVNVSVPDEPQTALWRSASIWSTSPAFQMHLTMKSEHEDGKVGVTPE
ncbi:hypothetical protein [Luteibacter yeojuensis]